MHEKTWFCALAILVMLGEARAAAPTLKALIVTGQTNKYHDWQATTPVLKKILEDSGLFKVDVAISPSQGQDMTGFKPDFAAYDVVVANYEGDAWPDKTRSAFVQYVRSGGGFVSFHAANNAFPGWPEYNEIIGLGGWGGRTEKSGPYLRLRNGKFVPDHSPGKGGSHGRPHAFVIRTHDEGHPITAGLPKEWMHAKDELYDRLRGPAKNITVLATAYSAPETGGSGEHEPILFTVKYGKGRVFHTVLGHGTSEMSCVGFITTLQRGAEWAATGKVTLKVPKDFPTADRVSVRN